MAGFDFVRGVDIKPQPRYCGDEFIQADALEYLQSLIESGEVVEFDAIHASPPCQAYTKARRLQGNQHPDLIQDTRRLLDETGLPYVIENVPGAPMVNPVSLTGQMFGLNVERERWFECKGFDMPFNLIPPRRRQVKMGRTVADGAVIQVVGHFSNVPYARKAMAIDWMTQGELAQAIPPAYTEHIGRQLLAAFTTPPAPADGEQEQTR